MLFNEVLPATQYSWTLYRSYSHKLLRCHNKEAIAYHSNLVAPQCSAELLDPESVQ